ncbi:hypothetical protein N7488_008353 [Penicillium malachiteum]|nr:hypothetical protein N7488_008353 [Penicillium malachiteum]
MSQRRRSGSHVVRQVNNQSTQTSATASPNQRTGATDAPANNEGQSEYAVQWLEEMLATLEPTGIVEMTRT